MVIESDWSDIPDDWTEGEDVETVTEEAPPGSIAYASLPRRLVIGEVVWCPSCRGKGTKGGRTCYRCSGHGIVPNEGPIPGISAGTDGPEQVVQRLGRPQMKAVGWWSHSNHYDEDCPVWYYRGVGRVVFNFNTTLVIATEADKTEEARPH